MVTLIHSGPCTCLKEDTGNIVDMLTTAIMITVLFGLIIKEQVMAITGDISWARVIME